MSLAEQLTFIEIKEPVNTINAESQIRMLHEKSDRFITVATIDKHKQYSQYHFHKDELIENLEKLISLGINTYISPNEFYVPKRSAETVRRLNALYVDLDLSDKNYKINDYELNLAIEILKDDYFNKVIPEPTFIVKTGRGLHLYWKLEDLPRQGLSLWTMIQGAMIDRLRGFSNDFRLLTVDEAVKDCTRILRLADSKNTKSNTTCKIEELYSDNIYRLDKLIKEYFTEFEIIEENKKNRAKVKTKAERKIIGIHNLYTLHHARLQDIVKLQELRNVGSVDYRRRMCFFYRYYSCLFTHDKELALKNTLDFNSKFAEPLTEKEVLQASAAAEKGYEEWLSNKAEDFLKPVWNPEEGTYNIKGYNYTNTSLIRQLEIMEEEQMQMSTIFSKKVKLIKYNTKRKADRRNENGLTLREQQKEDTKNKIKELKSQGFTQKEVAEKLNKGIATVKRYWNK